MWPLYSVFFFLLDHCKWQCTRPCPRDGISDSYHHEHERVQPTFWAVSIPWVCQGRKCPRDYSYWSVCEYWFTRYKTTLFIHCGNEISTLKHIIRTHKHIRNCTNDWYSHPSKLQSTRTTGLTFTPNKHSSILHSLRRPRTPILCRCVLRLSACLLIVCPNGRWNERLGVSCCPTKRTPKAIAPVRVSIVKFRSQWVCVSSAKIVLSLFVTHLLDVFVQSVFVSFGCVFTSASYSKS